MLKRKNLSKKSPKASNPLINKEILNEIQEFNIKGELNDIGEFQLKLQCDI